MTMAQTTNPYADAYDAYWAAGWRGVLPLPYQKKTPPPDGYTGRNAAEPSYADCAAWADGTAANIALHLPTGVIGVDVDDYAGKGGGDTLQRLVDECGSLPPTWMSTSRGDGISGIRLYRVPAGVELVSALTGGIEIIQAHHRYVVCWPSLHPEGRVYEWINEATGAAEIPAVESLPYLPAEWIDRLAAARTGGHDKADVDDTIVAEFMAGLPTGDPCAHIHRAAGIALSGESRHDSYNHATLAVLSRGRQGCPGAKVALDRMQRAFVAEIAAPGERATVPEALGEWFRNINGAIAIVLAEHPQQGAACIDDYMAELALNEEPREAPTDGPDATQDGEPDTEASTPADGTKPPAEAYERAVRMEATKLKLRDDAKEMLAAIKAGEAPTLGGVNLADFLAQPDNPIAYRIRDMWPLGGRVLLPAAAKAGKTTMVTNLLKCLADGGDFLGVYETIPVNRRIVYLNMEVGADQMRSWLRRVQIQHEDRIVVENLRGKASALTLSTAKGRTRVARWLADHDAELVILDPIAPLLGSLGLDENSNSDVATFFAWWSETLYEAGASDDFLAHHAGWDGSRSRGASRLVDEPDAIWTISRDKATDDDGDDVYGIQEPRFLKAIGRDVELPDRQLIFDAVTGMLRLGDANRKQLRSVATQQRAEAVIMAKLAEGPAVQNVLTRGGGVKYQDAKDALERLVIKEMVVREKVGQAFRYSLATNRHPTPTDTGCRVSVTDTHPFRGVGTDHDPIDGLGEEEE